MADKYEPPQAIYLHDSDRAYGGCTTGSVVRLYRAFDPVGVCTVGTGVTAVCVTGLEADGGCHAGA
jgi:hypothetical protein